MFYFKRFKLKPVDDGYFFRAIEFIKGKVKYLSNTDFVSALKLHPVLR